MDSFLVRLVHQFVNVPADDTTAQLDDGNLEFLYSYADPSLINQVLFSAAGLPDDNEHTVVGCPQ
jgi:hypothetical protein